MFDVKNSLSPDEAAFVARLNEAIEAVGGASVVSERETVALKTVYNWKTGANASAAMALGRIARACGRSVDWLVGVTDTPDQARAIPDLADRVVEVPILDIAAGAGSAVDNGEVAIREYMPFPRTVLRRLGIKPENVRGLRSSGDSMWPTIGDAQLVLIDIAGLDLRDGRIYALGAPDGLRLKRVQRHFDGGVVLISDNKDLYQPEIVPRDDAAGIRVVGRAFWTEKLI